MCLSPHKSMSVCCWTTIYLCANFKCFIVCSSEYKLNMLVFHESTRDAFDLVEAVGGFQLELYKISAKVLVCTISFPFLFSLSLDQLFNWTASYCFFSMRIWNMVYSLIAWTYNNYPEKKEKRSIVLISCLSLLTLIALANSFCYCTCYSLALCKERDSCFKVLCNNFEF